MQKHWSGRARHRSLNDWLGDELLDGHVWIDGVDKCDECGDVPMYGTDVSSGFGCGTRVW